MAEVILMEFETLGIPVEVVDRRMLRGCILYLCMYLVLRRKEWPGLNTRTLDYSLTYYINVILHVRFAYILQKRMISVCNLMKGKLLRFFFISYSYL